MNTYKLEDNENEKQYEYRVGEHTARIEYIKSQNGEIFLTHTMVPARIRKQGIASALAADVLKDIERQSLRVIPLCPFVAYYIKQHPEWMRIVKDGVNIK